MSYTTMWTTAKAGIIPLIANDSYLWNTEQEAKLNASAGTSVVRVDLEVKAVHPFHELCGACREPKLECYEHCVGASDGVHVPDPASPAVDSDAGRNRGTDWIVDIDCQNCGLNGSTRLDLESIEWE